MNPSSPARLDGSPRSSWGGVHIAALVIAGFFFLVFIFGRQQIHQSRLAGPIPTPTHHLTVASIGSFSPTTPVAFNPDPPTTLIATFPTEQQAARLFHQLQPNLPADAVIECFGQSLFLNLPASDPAAQSTWRGRLGPKSADLFVDGRRSNTIVTLSCLAPNLTAARSIEQDCNAYFLLSSAAGHLIPPWSPMDSRPLDVKQKQTRARRTYQKILAMMTKTYQSPELTELSKQISAAYQQDLTKVHQAAKQYDNRVRQLWVQNAGQLRQQNDLDRTVIDRCIQTWTRHDGRGDETDLLQQAAAELGQLPLKDGAPTSQADRFSALTGHVRRRFWTLTFVGVEFKRLPDGAPALVKWLSDKGGTDFKYTFQQYKLADLPTSRLVVHGAHQEKLEKLDK